VKEVVTKLLANVDEVIGVLSDEQKEYLVKTVVEINSIGNMLMAEVITRDTTDVGTSLRFVLRGEKRILQERIRVDGGKKLWMDVPFVGKVEE